MATPAQLFFKKIILSIINFVKKNWFLLILLGLAIVLFCALLKDNIEESFDSTPLPINPDATNPLLTEGNIYGIIPYEASANLYNVKEIIDQGDSIANGPDPKKEFTMTTTTFTFDSTQDNSEAKLSASIYEIIINEMAKSTTFGGNGTTATAASLAAATTAFNSIMGITATSSNTNGLNLQTGAVSPGAAAAFSNAQGIAADSAQDKAQEKALARAKLIGEKIRPAVTAAAVAGAAAIAAGVNLIRGTPAKALSPQTAIGAVKKVDKTLLKRVGPAAKKIAVAIGAKIAAIVAGRTVAMHALAGVLVATGVGMIPGAMLEIIANICTGLNLVMQPIMAGVLMGKDPQCPAGYTLLSDSIPKNITDALEPIPIIGDILGMLGPTICWINACPPGLQEDAGLCYSPCDQNYKGVGPVCWTETKDIGAGVMRGCPSGYTDIGLICSNNQTLAPIGKFDNDSRLVCPSNKPDLIDGLCYGRCDYTPAYTVTTKLPRFIRQQDVVKIQRAKDQLDAARRLATKDPATLNDLWVVYWASHGASNGAANQNYWNHAPITGTLEQFNSLILLEGASLIPSNMILPAGLKTYYGTLANGNLLQRYNATKAEPAPANAPFIPNPDVPVPDLASFTDPAPVQEPEFIGTYQKCTGNPNQWVPPIPGKAAIPAIPGTPAIPAKPATPYIPAVPAGPSIPAVTYIPDQISYPTMEMPVPPGYDFDTTQNRYVSNPNSTTMRNVTVVGYMNGYTPVYGPLIIPGRAAHPEIPGTPYQYPIYAQPAQPEIPAIPGVPAVPAVPEVPGYFKNTQVCLTLPKPNPLYSPKQYATELAAWQTKKYNTPPPASTPDSSIPTWDNVVTIPAQYPAVHVPGMPYLCGGRRGLSYGRGAGKPKLSFEMPLPYTAPADPPAAQSADNFTDLSNFKCNSDYKSTYALNAMCTFYYKAARAHASEEAYGATGTRPAVGTIVPFTYIKSITKVKASSERSCDVICQMASKTITITSISPFIFTTSSTTTPITGNTDRRFYFAKIPALCNLAPNTTTPLKLSYIPFACTNTTGFALDAISSDASYSISTYTFTAPP
jgi:hypothetical protein